MEAGPRINRGGSSESRVMSLFPGSFGASGSACGPATQTESLLMAHGVDASAATVFFLLAPLS